MRADGGDGVQRGAARTLPFDGQEPDLADDAFVADGATVVGRVRVGTQSSVWYGAVLRGDSSYITIGDATNIQDGCVGHADPDHPLVVGDRVTVGHRAVVHGCTIEDEALIGIGSVVLNGAHVGRGAVVAAGAVVTPGAKVPAGALVAGIPAKVVRDVSEAEREHIARGVDVYIDLAARHRSGS